MKNQRFKQEDIERWESIYQEIKGNGLPQFVTVSYLDESLQDVDLPVLLFEQLLKQNVANLDPSEKIHIQVDRMAFEDNWWWKDEPCMWLGDKDGNSKFLINPDKKDELTTVGLLAGMLGMFRYITIFRNENLISVVQNDNVERWFEWMEKKTNHGRNLLNHVFFEVTPYNIACKLFACEILGIPYVSGKFTITCETLDFLETDKWVIGKDEISVEFEDGSIEVVEVDVLHKELVLDTVRRGVGKAIDVRYRRDKKLTSGFVAAYDKNGSSYGSAFLF